MSLDLGRKEIFFGDLCTPTSSLVESWVRVNVSVFEAPCLSWACSLPNVFYGGDGCFIPTKLENCVKFCPMVVEITTILLGSRSSSSLQAENDLVFAS